jgi:phosphoenolpyruvate synthase/pyruvate phosphate dikinase
MDRRNPSHPAERPGSPLQLEWLGDLVDPDRDRFGSKSVNLALMARWGLPVPDGFAVAFQPGHPGILSPEEERLLRDAYTELCRRAGSSPLPVAVRSSAVGEDGEELSFAGQYQTRLEVIGEPALIQAVEECLASQTSERALSYLRAAGARPAGMGVLIQRMVRAECAGVCFTQSPVSIDEVAIEVVEGVGESLVSGERSPARVCLGRERLELRSSDDPEEILEQLGREGTRKLAQLALEAETGFGFPVDVEWAFASGEIWLVQSRPITAALRSSVAEGIRRDEIERLERMARKAGRVLAWSDFSLADMVPRPSLLAIELFNLMADHGGSFDRTMRTFGLRYAGPEQVGRTFEVICGRAYLNLGASVQFIDEALPLALDAESLPASGESSVDVEHIPVRLAWRGWRSARRLPDALLRWLFLAPARFFRLRHNFDREFRAKVQPAVTAEAARLRERDLRGLGSAELSAALRSHVQRFVDLGYHHQIADSVAFVTHSLLRRSLRRLYGDQADVVEARLTTGLPGNFNTETNLDLARVAAGEIGMEEFLDRYGHRGSPDYEISAPRWREDPRRAEAMAKAIARAGVDPFRKFEEQQRIRAQAEARFSAEIWKDLWLRPWRRAILRELDYYQRYSPLRESTQALCFLFIELARRVLLEAARRAGVGELIFYLTLAEVERLIAQGADPEVVERARSRRERLQAARRIYVPHLVRSDDLDAIGRAPPVDPAARELLGQSVSAGVVRGRARVVQGLDEARELEAGEILVAASADPSWTPLFLVAGGIVLEQGGMLSHPAIVAREYGLPAVVDVPHSTRLIRTGQLLLVDANRGRVVVEDSRSQPGPARRD